MYEWCDWIRCKECGNTNCLFKLRTDAHEKKRTGNIKYKITRICKLCYLENCKIKNERYIAKKENRNKINARNRFIRKGNPKYQAMARKYRLKNKELINEKKRTKYIHRNNRPDIVKRIKQRQSIISHVYVS